MELNMGCFVAMRSILFHRGPLACLLAVPVPPNSKFFIWCQVPKVKAVSSLSKVQVENKISEKVWLFCFGVPEFGSLGQFCTRAHLSSTPRLFLFEAAYWLQHSSLETGGENRFRFPLLRLIHRLQGGKSSKTRVQCERNLFWAVYCVQHLNSPAPPPLTQFPLLQLRVRHEA